MPQRIRKAWRQAPPLLRVPATVAGRTFRYYYDDGCGTHAAAIAFYALFSLVPLSLIILSSLGLVVDRQEIVDFVFEQIPLEETDSVRESVNELIQRAQEISVAGISFGLLALVWAGTGIFGAVRRGLNTTGHRSGGRPYWHGKLIDFALIPGLGVLILLSISLTAASQVAIDRTAEVGPFSLNENAAVHAVSYALPAAISLVMFVLLYHYVPSVRPPRRDTLSAALFATIAFEIVKVVGAFFVRKAPFSTDTAIYAGFSTAFVFLFWMFICASILLLGSEFSRAVALAREEHQLEAGRRARESADGRIAPGEVPPVASPVGGGKPGAGR